MTVTTHIDGTTWRLSFPHPTSLTDYSPAASAKEARALHLIEDVVDEVPGDSAGRQIDLQPLLDRFPGLRELSIEAHVFTPGLAHETVVHASLSGAIALSKLSMPQLTTLRLDISGDEHGVATPFEAFSGLLGGEGTPRLKSLDARGLDVELTKSKRPSFVDRWVAAPILPQLRQLGIPGEEVKLKELKSKVDAFAHLEVLAVSRLRSATDKNPIGQNVIFESEFPEVPLAELRETIQSLPRLQDLKPSLKDAPFEELVAKITQSPVRFDEGPLASTVGRFCKRGQWARVREVMDLAKQKAPHRRAFMNVREKAQEQVHAYLKTHPEDQVGRALFAELEEQNRL